jgi:hypothetical protein
VFFEPYCVLVGSQQTVVLYAGYGPAPGRLSGYRQPLAELAGATNGIERNAAQVRMMPLQSHYLSLKLAQEKFLGDILTARIHMYIRSL